MSNEIWHTPAKLIRNRSCRSRRHTQSPSTKVQNEHSNHGSKSSVARGTQRNASRRHTQSPLCAPHETYHGTNEVGTAFRTGRPQAPSARVHMVNDTTLHNWDDALLSVLTGTSRAPSAPELRPVTLLAQAVDTQRRNGGLGV